MSTDITKKPIGIFDSGVGGLTVVREVIKLFPNERIVYFGDTARIPYGSKSKDTIIHYARQIIRFLLTQDVKVIIIACNTATAYALSTVKKEFNLPIIGVVKPGAKTAIEVTRNNTIGVIGTEGTIGSKTYSKVIHSINKDSTVIGQACPLLCPLVEEGLINDSVTLEITRRYLSPFLETNIDTLIMGCTHYPLLESVFSSILGDNVTLVNPAYETAITLENLLIKHDIVNICTPVPDIDHYKFFVSDEALKFKTFANSIMHFDVETIQKIQIEKY